MLHATLLSDRALLRWGLLFAAGVTLFGARHWIASDMAVYLGLAAMAPLPLVLLGLWIARCIASLPGDAPADPARGAVPAARRRPARSPVGGPLKVGKLKLPQLLRGVGRRRVAELPGMDIRVLRSALIELADRGEQERLWLGRAVGELSYFDEAVTQAFEDSGLLDAVESGLLEQRYPAAAVAAIDGLSRAVEAVPSHLSQERIIADASMVEVRRRARALLGLLAGVKSKRHSA